MKKAPEEDLQQQIAPEDIAEPVIEDVVVEAPAAQEDARVNELIADLQRTRADFENYRKQTDLQKTQAMAAAKQATIQKFLPLIDDINRAISAYSEQLAPLAKNFTKLLSSLDLSMIDSSAGVEFNPDLHEAVSVDDSDGEVEVITETLRPGYLYGGEVLRAAMVKVGHADKKSQKA